MIAASKYHGFSVNIQLMPGPDLMQKLTGVICRFRQKKVAISADIEGMFMQVGVRPQDQKFLRFLWKEGEKPICFQLRRHIFGAMPYDEQRRTTVSSTLQQPRQSYVPFTWLTCITQQTQSKKQFPFQRI